MPTPQEGRRIRGEHGGGKGRGKLKVLSRGSHGEWCYLAGLTWSWALPRSCGVTLGHHLGTSLGVSFLFFKRSSWHWLTSKAPANDDGLAFDVCPLLG